MCRAPLWVYKLHDLVRVLRLQGSRVPMGYCRVSRLLLLVAAAAAAGAASAEFKKVYANV